MQLTIEVPDDVAEDLREAWGDVHRHVLETVAVEGYKSGALSSYQVRLMLGYGTPMELDDLLARSGVPRDYAPEDLERDYEVSRRASSEHLGEPGQ
jgi:predicted HTH domain antitoxin